MPPEYSVIEFSLTSPTIGGQFISTSEVRAAKSDLEIEVRNHPGKLLLEIFSALIERLPCAIPTLASWLADNGYTRSRTFSVEGLIEAADLYNIELPFRALSTVHTKWLIDIEDSDLNVDFVDAFAAKALSIVPRCGIVDVNDFDSLRAYFHPAHDPDFAWEVMDACPGIAAVDGTTFLVARRPLEDAKVVLRLDRLLSFVGAVPVEIALKQITRDGRHGVLPIDDVNALEAFVTHCTYYDIEDGDIVSRRKLIVDQELSSLEHPVILALVEKPDGATIGDIAALTPNNLDVSQIQRVVATSSLVVSLPDDRFALLDSSMYDQLVAKSEVTTPDISEFAATLNDLLHAGDRVDLAQVGTSGEYWWAMYAGPIPRQQLDGALKRSQRYMPILDPATEKCLGMVRTSRVFNKYSAGIPTVLADDNGLKGIELPRLVSGTQLRSALAEAPFVFYNDSTKTGQKSWGIVQKQNIDWN